MQNYPVRRSREGEMEKSARRQCISIKSKKHPELRCPNTAREESDWCSNHKKSQIPFTQNIPSESCSNAAPRYRPLVSKEQNEVGLWQKESMVKRIQTWWKWVGRRKLRKELGPATFVPTLAHNDKDISTYDSVETIPKIYRFSYIDSKHHLWLFDLRCLMNLLQYGSELKNPFTQEILEKETVGRLQRRAEQLRNMGKPCLYTDEDELTPEQQWNQKVLDVFLKLTSLGYSVNVQWFESLTIRGHEMFYTKLFELWNVRLQLTEEEKEKIVPGFHSGRHPLFRWHPSRIVGRILEIRWWRKQNIQLMRNFLTRTDDKETQSCGALYLLTALANVHPRCGECFPWLVEDID